MAAHSIDRGSMDITPYIGTIVAVVTAMGATYAAINSRLAKLETLISELKGTVEKHNSVIERTYKLESDMATAFKRVDELKDADLRLEQKIEKAG